MAHFSIDVSTGQGIIHFRKGGQVARTSVFNGQTCRWDINSNLIEVLVSPFTQTGCHLGSLPEYDEVKRMLTNFVGVHTFGSQGG